MSTAILTHAACPDGWAASHWLRHCLELNAVGPDEITIVECHYGDPPPLQLVTGADVFITDFCFPGPELDEIALVARSVLVLDHHQSAHGYVNDSGYAKFDEAEYMPFVRPQAGAVINEARSGIGNVIEFCYLHLRWAGAEPAEEPTWLLALERRDLWDLDGPIPNVREIFAAVTSYLLDQETFDRLLETPTAHLTYEGNAISRYRDRLVEQTVATAWEEEICGVVMPVCAAPYAIGSDVAGKLAESHPNKVAAYTVPYGDRVRYGLRSRDDGPDVAELAAMFGGGGHKHAAGFEVPIGDAL